MTFSEIIPLPGKSASFVAKGMRMNRWHRNNITYNCILHWITFIVCRRATNIETEVHAHEFLQASMSNAYEPQERGCADIHTAPVLPTLKLVCIWSRTYSELSERAPRNFRISSLVAAFFSNCAYSKSCCSDCVRLGCTGRSI